MAAVAVGNPAKEGKRKEEAKRRAVGSLARAMKRAEAIELAKQRAAVGVGHHHRRVPSVEDDRKVLHTAPGKLQSHGGDKLPSIFSRPTLNLNSGSGRAVVQRPNEAALLRKLPSLHGK